MRVGVLLALTLLSGCNMSLPDVSGPEISVGDDIAERTARYIPLVNLPPRNDPITIAVYAIPDKTGANLRTEDFAEFSKAVTQGADALVVEALSETGRGTWFKIVERESIDPLLQERRMAMAQIEDMRQRETVLTGLSTVEDQNAVIDAEIEQYRQQLYADYNSARVNKLAQMPPLEQALADLERYAVSLRVKIPTPLPYDRFARPPPLPEMAIADYIVTGAIVAHDSDVVAEGTGVRFQNIGILNRAQKDVITVSLRIVRVSDGEIIANRTVSQTVVSKKKRGDILNYVTLNQILEFESGTVTNEPRSLALDAAFRLALSEMFIDLNGRW